MKLDSFSEPFFNKKIPGSNGFTCDFIEHSKEKCQNLAHTISESRR